MICFLRTVTVSLPVSFVEEQANPKSGTSQGSRSHAINNSWSSQSPAHEGITNQMLFQLAADGGSNIIRVPLDLSVVGPSGPPQWVVEAIGTVLQQAASLGLKVILEPGQTPPDLLPAGSFIPSTGYRCRSGGDGSSLWRAGGSRSYPVRSICKHHRCMRSGQ